MTRLEVGYLGPEGTYSHLVAEKYYGGNAKLVPLSTILDICTFVARKRGRRGVVPIENSSGGAIHETVDILLAGKPPVTIESELTLVVRLALLGHRGKRIRRLYSHFAPLEHCDGWVRSNLRGVRKEALTSTAAAARRVLEEPDAAALGSRRLGRLYGLDVLAYPVEGDVPNLTAFLAIGAPAPAAAGGKGKTTLAVRLPNVPGSLCTFLDTFRTNAVNLSRLISRPVRGSHREYAFLVDMDGWRRAPRVARALAAAKPTCAELRVVGSYPQRRPYTS